LESCYASFQKHSCLLLFNFQGALPVRDLSLTACILYHSASRLSTLFSKVFSNFFPRLVSSGSLVPLSRALRYYTTSPLLCQYLFSSFFKIIRVLPFSVSIDFPSPSCYTFSIIILLQRSPQFPSSAMPPGMRFIWTAKTSPMRFSSTASATPSIFISVQRFPTTI